jgi:PEP-CTERM motif
MKRLITIFAAVSALVLAFSLPVLATTVLLSGTFSGVDSDTGKDNGVGNYDYAIDQAPASTFYWSSGSTVSITGTVDVRGLTSGSYLQIGLVDKEQAGYAFSYDDPSAMFNNSALATFYAGTRNYAQLTDDNARNSASLYNPTGATAGVFNFEIDILSNGTMDLTLHGNSDVSTTYTYGERNWWDGWSGWSGGELANGSYLISQLWIDTGNTTSSVSASYNITGTSVPEPATMCLLGLGAFVLRRKK